MEAQLPALQIVVPLMAALAIALLRHPGWAWGTATLACLASAWISLLLAEPAARGETAVYALGGWIAPYGIEYRIDALNALVLVIINFASLLALIHARRSIPAELPPDRIHWLYCAWMLCLTGLAGMTITGDAFNVFVFLEIASLASYILVALGPKRDALLAAFRYLIPGSIGATFFLIGLGLLYMTTGTLNMADMAQRIAGNGIDRTIAAGVLFVVVGIGVKAAIFPLHAWLPSAYEQAPSSAAAFLAGASTKVSLYILMRFIFDIFGIDLAFGMLDLDLLLIVLAIASVVAGSLVAVQQEEVKRLLAWSSIAQIGYMALGMALGSAAGIAAATLHLFNHALMKVALFLAIGNFVYRTGSSALASLVGAGRGMPWTMAAFVVAGLSLIGIPLTAGFVSKWYLLGAALDRGLWPIALLILVSSVVAAIYLWRVASAAFEPAPSDSPAAGIVEAPWTMLAPLLFLAAANLWFGVDPLPALRLVEQAAVQLALPPVAPELVAPPLPLPPLPDTN
ncbi:MAG: monovalent cation/H+ antiporter subunit D family protein [Ectothiorhodospiraceae bacterium AqS1]|nr:monovalent cation/H+ antiporter subunit D family protein [Ectothiorhodospiraceae bacterium AqS1]